MMSIDLSTSEPGLGDAAQPLAVAREDVDAEFFFQLEDGLADARLRGVQRLGGLGQVEVAAHRLLHEAELVQVHAVPPGAAPSSSCSEAPPSPRSPPAARRSRRAARQATAGWR
jgi:hypothetical protein